MVGKFSYGYIKEAVRGHLDLEEAELEVMNINQRFHIFANEAMSHICAKKPKYLYFQFEAISSFTPLLFDDGVLRMATHEEQHWSEYGLAEPAFATSDETTEWYNSQDIYLVGQVIEMPDDFLAFAVKKAFMWTDYLTNKQPVTKTAIMYLSNTEIVVTYAATYQIPYQATWATFAQDDDEDAIIPMPADLVLTIPIYVASVCLQQRDLNMATAKRQEFEIALNRCRSTNFLENISITPSFE